jgi:Mg2+-importing ATPase
VDLASGRRCRRLPPVPEGGARTRLRQTFTDQALPSAGLSSSILIAKGLERRRLPSTAVNASVLVNVASYHLAYVAALLGALVMLHRRGDANALVTVTAVLFLLFRSD